ncbi:hypothetical protein WR25_03960 [Diploscapter pachys]|uniref:Uncharacterized protein n=1 Tax=Diploscapter pachys TaxID=2018661 RepID=A0A2A2LJ63_9BILA|nr:hypothetical protein WR25_03960 [Diploscapter pachys]
MSLFSPSPLSAFAFPSPSSPLTLFVVFLLQIVAEQQGDIQKAQEFQRQIDELDNKTDRLDKERSKDIKGISWINQRNRNVIRNTVLSGKLKFDVTSEDDPFTRKKGVMKVVSGSKHAVGSSSQTQQPDVNT